ncbi:MAG: S-methyl-5-thioribose-1-phosphate isomerase [Halieaceae bacterium]
MFSADDLSSLRWDSTSGQVEIIDQTLLPHTLRWCHLAKLADFCHAISAMQVRGAPLIGITAAYGLACALADNASDSHLREASDRLTATRPTAVNLQWALDQMAQSILPLPEAERAAAALEKAHSLRAEDITTCERIGLNGAQVLPATNAADTLNIMTHCNAGWLATVQWGTALAPIYQAQAQGRAVHVWVSETRPRNQGMNLTAWELQRAGVPCTVVADNSCGLLMQQGKVDCVIVGSDRTAGNGDVCNKVGTYLKALAAAAHELPFYVALPVSTIDWQCASGADIPIEERGADEVLSMLGRDAAGELLEVRLAAADTLAANPAFDVTPARFVTRLITEVGVFPANADGMTELRGAIG